MFGNVLRYGTYPLSVSAERAIQARVIVDVARQRGARALANGSTGAGNDQVRFDAAWSILAPEMAIIIPIRDGNIIREQALAYLHAHGVSLEHNRPPYSVNRGIWVRRLADVKRSFPTNGCRTMPFQHQSPKMVASGWHSISSEGSLSVSTEHCSNIHLAPSLRSNRLPRRGASDVVFIRAIRLSVQKDGLDSRLLLPLSQSQHTTPSKSTHSRNGSSR